jgi:hypothetical protein
MSGKPLIVGISGRKQSGKSSTAEFLVNELHDKCDIFTFAEPLKDLIKNVMGLTHEQVYGTDEQKNTATQYKWEDMPGVVNPSFEDKWGNICYDWDLVPHDSGAMTAREVMQYVGTEIFRKMNPNIWVETAFRTIAKKPSVDIIFIPDVRFPNEVHGIKDKGGIVIRLCRDPYQSDHHSETALDQHNFSWRNFDLVIENESLTLLEKNTMVFDWFTTYLRKNR